MFKVLEATGGPESVLVNWLVGMKPVNLFGES
jgi:hypothetical protein